MPDGRTRRVLCLLLPVVQVLAALLPWFGIGQPVAAASAASQTPVIPAGYAFAIWGVIFALCLAYGIWQALPAERSSALARRTGWPLATCMAANTLWMVVATLSGRIGFGLLLIILVGLAAAVVALWQATRTPEPGWAPRWIVAPLVGLMAGWLSAAAFANLSGAAYANGVLPGSGLGATVAAVLIVLAAGGFAAAVATFAGGDRWYVGAVVWALVAIVAANLGLNGVNIPVALVAAGLVGLLLTLALRRGVTAAPPTSHAQG